MCIKTDTTSYFTTAHPARVILPSILVLFLAGCVTTRYEPSDIYPSCGAPYQECTVDLTGYKSPQQRTGEQDANLALSIAISGGGFRASNFAAGVLAGLEQINPPADKSGNCLGQVDYFSTVSGGGFTASTYFSSLYDYMRFTGSIEGYSFSKVLLQNPLSKLPTVKKDKTVMQNYSYDPTVKRHLQGFYPDDINRLVSDILNWLFRNFKKGGKFERIIDDTFLGYKFRQLKLQSLNEKSDSVSLRLGDVFVRKDDPNEVRFPMWAANAAAYENGVLFPFMPDHLKLYGIIEYRHREKQVRYQPEKQNYDNFLYNVPLSVGVMASANFPGATLPTTLRSNMDPKNPYLHLFDGGLADGMACITAVRLLENEQDKRVSRKAMIVIDAYGGTFEPFSQIRFPPPPASTALRIMSIALDSWHARYREIISDWCREKNIAVIYLSFDDLANLEDCKSLLDFGLTENDIKELTKKSKLIKPFDLLRNVATIKTEDKGLLSTAEQNLLISAGRYVVQQKRTEILSALNW
jgi:hypothetical protein